MGNVGCVETVTQQSRMSIYVAISVMATIFLLCLGEVLRSEPTIIGDGEEYLAYVYNMARGHGLNIVEVPPGISVDVKSKLTRLNAGDAVAHLGTGTRVGQFIKDREGKIITWHWWGYSAFSLPVYLLLDSLNVAPMWTFAAVNFGFVCLLLCYLARFSRQSVEFRALFGCLFMLSGTSFYLWWPHPEVMTAAMTALGLVAWLDRRAIFSILCLAVASTQNPPVALLITLPAVCLIFAWVKAVRGKRGLRTPTFDVMAAVTVGLIVFVPSGWYLKRIGVQNPIVATGAAQFRLEDFSKSLGLFFDLNEGMVLVQFATFLVVGAYLLAEVLNWKRATEQDRKRVLVVCLILAVTYLMSVLAASSENWNPGITVISRYSYWLSMPVIFAATLILSSLACVPVRNLASLFLIFSGVFQISCWGLHGKDSSYLKFTPPSKLAMQVLPRSYFPHPEIFCERAQGKEGCTFDRAYVFGRAGQAPMRVLVEETFLVGQCEGQNPREEPTKRERYGGRNLLWFSSAVTCPSGLRVDSFPHVSSAER